MRDKRRLKALSSDVDLVVVERFAHGGTLRILAGDGTGHALNAELYTAACPHPITGRGPPEAPRSAAANAAAATQLAKAEMVPAPEM